ncbi:MAG: hypothetical protein JKX70_05065 [Phycisphaerales bacterium]|nr:hypothetical protein [Phycisphaerales bacterium]
MARSKLQLETQQPAMLPEHPKLGLELRLTPWGDREDAAQEAWLAKLEGRNPARAVATYAQRQRRRRKRERSATDCGLAACSMN